MDLRYESTGTLRGSIRNHRISVHHDGQRHFNTMIDGQSMQSVSQRFVEDELGVRINLKKSGSQAGYPSETVPRAIFRHLADRYNDGDITVSYSPD